VPEASRRVLAVVNPSTGRVASGVIADELRRQASLHSVNLTIAFTEHAGHAVDLARAASTWATVVIAAGGDGTVSDVVTGLIGTHVPVAIVPAGSTNMIAKELAIPRDLRQAVSVAFTSMERTDVDVAQAGETTFLHIAGAGFDAAIMRDTDPARKRRIGWLAYLPAGARNLSYPSFDLELTVDDVTTHLPARTVLCAIGGSIIHPRFRIGEGIDRSDGLVDVCVYNPPSLLATLSTAWWIARGKPGRSRWLRQFRGRSIRLSSSVAIPFEVDGDPSGNLPVEILALDQRVTFVVPPPGD
jgi:YegS/Rv2252/BmrU family lipid kinase